MIEDKKLETYISSVVPAEFLIPKSNNINDISNSILSSASIISQKGINVSENIILKTIITIIIRNNIDSPIELYILIGLNDLDEQDIKSLNTETAHINHITQLLLEQTNEEIPLNKVNMALSNIIDKLPNDISEQIPPYKKQELNDLLLSVVQQTYSKPKTKESFSSVFSNLNYTTSYSLINPLNSVSYNDIINYEIQTAQQHLQQQQELKKQQKISSLPYILAEYVDTEPILYTGIDNKAYIYDSSSNTIHYLPSHPKTITNTELINLLNSYKINQNVSQI